MLFPPVDRSKKKKTRASFLWGAELTMALSGTQEGGQLNPELPISKRGKDPFGCSYVLIL